MKIIGLLSCGRSGADLFQSLFNVDFYGAQIDKSIDSSWIVFPWENIKK